MILRVETIIGSSDISPNIPSTRMLSARLRIKWLTRSAIVHGMSHLIGSVAVGQMADLAFWDFDSFGARPNMIVKGGVIAWAQVSPSDPPPQSAVGSKTDIRWAMQMDQSRRFNQ